MFDRFSTRKHVVRVHTRATRRDSNAALCTLLSGIRLGRSNEIIRPRARGAVPEGRRAGGRCGRWGLGGGGAHYPWVRDYAAPLAPTLNVRQLARLAAAGTLQAPHTDTPAQVHTRGSMQLTCIVARFRKKAVGERDGAGALVFLAALSFAASARL